MSAACFNICILSISIICSLIIVIRSISAMCRAEKAVDNNVFRGAGIRITAIC
ncbi:hypothetical protein SDC9_115040 [bioreactor metagenome]|uniref:Uncharacterized protein n=1 Tax=bioreactor metagenome TaxID=1076179 RepID=A0A645BRQ8_9ZZZZ|nr:hypothetical protein [Candidatus Metalachnospira sp.]